MGLATYYALKKKLFCALKSFSGAVLLIYYIIDFTTLVSSEVLRKTCEPELGEVSSIQCNVLQDGFMDY